MLARIKEDIAAIRSRDPAARSSLEVALCYPGLHAVTLHRLAHGLWRRQMFLAGRMVSAFTRFLTGIEIHPGAQLGRRVVIDHGLGVVIGETAEVGDDVLLYHGVTLGGTALQPGKRHPTLGARVIVGAGAKVVGAILVGEDARIGANAVVITEVPAGTTMVGIPARSTDTKARAGIFQAYGLSPDCAADPLIARVQHLEGELAALKTALAETQRYARPAPRAPAVEEGE